MPKVLHIVLERYVEQMPVDGHEVKEEIVVTVEVPMDFRVKSMEVKEN